MVFATKTMLRESTAASTVLSSADARREGSWVACPERVTARMSFRENCIILYYYLYYYDYYYYIIIIIITRSLLTCIRSLLTPVHHHHHQHHHYYYYCWVCGYNTRSLLTFMYDDVTLCMMM